ncbi:MAG: TonB-dependent receptor [Bryobacteraceae bacterium]|nr:TonB-dependent receptor [Bryobacteraceae bacterium]
MNWVFTLAVILCAYGAYGQVNNSAELRGRVTDPSEAAVAGARVEARSLQTGIVRSVNTDETGAYVVANLLPGPYEVLVEAAGFGPARSARQVLQVGERRDLDFRLTVRDVAEQVEVTGRDAAVAPAQTASSQALSQEYLRNIPVNSRNFVQMVLHTPGVAPTSTAGSRGYMGDRYRENQFSFAGLRFQNNYQTMDGTDFYVYIANAAKSFYSYEAVQELRVINGAPSAELGHGMGGLITAVTRSGGRNWNFAAYEYFRNNRLDAADLLAIPGFRVFRRNQFGGTAGGPVLRDKLFTFWNVEAQRQANSPRFPRALVANLEGINQGLARLGLPAESTSVVQTANNTQGLFRADAAPSATHRLFARYNHFVLNHQNDRIGSPGAASDPIGSVGARHYRLRDRGVSAHWSLFPSSVFVHQASFGWSDHSYRLDPRPGLPRMEVAILGAFSTAMEGADELATSEQRFHAQESLHWVAGKHQVRAGGEFLHTRILHEPSLVSFGVVSNLAALLSPDPTVALVRFLNRVPPIRPHANQWGFYIQDEYRPARRLTLSLGLRYDVELFRGRTGLVRDDWNNWQPRGGFGLALNDSTVLRGGGGMYVADRAHAILLADYWAHGYGFPGFNEEFRAANPFVSVYKPLPDAPSITGLVGPEADRAFREFIRTGSPPQGLAGGQQLLQVHHPEMRNPRALRWSAEVERRIGRDTWITAGYNGLSASGMPLAVNRNLRPAVAALPSGKSDYQAIGPQAAARLWDPRFGPVFIVDGLGESVYHGGTLALRRRFSHSIGLNASYTFSRSIDNGPTASVIATPEDSYRLDLERGLSSEHVKHRLVAAVNAAVPDRVRGFGGMALALLAIAQSPRFHTITAGADWNRDGSPNSDRPDQLGRNTWAGDNFFTVDARASRRFTISDKTRLLFTVDLFNVLNRVNITDFSTVYGGPSLSAAPISTFGTPRAVANARQVQIGVRLTR